VEGNYKQCFCVAEQFLGLRLDLVFVNKDFFLEEVLLCDSLEEICYKSVD